MLKCLSKSNILKPIFFRDDVRVNGRDTAEAEAKTSSRTRTEQIQVSGVDSTIVIPNSGPIKVQGRYGGQVYYDRQGYGSNNAFYQTPYQNPYPYYAPPYPPPPPTPTTTTTTTTTVPPLVQPVQPDQGITVSTTFLSLKNF